MKRIFVCSLVALFFALATATVRAAGSNTDLLQALQTARDGILKSEQSGSGEAEADGIAAIRFGGTPLANERCKVVFSFDSEASRSDEYCPPTAADSVVARFANANRCYAYIRTPGRPPGVMVDKIFGNAEINPEVIQWSIKGLAAIPLFEDDEAFFRLVTKPPSDLNVAVSMKNTECTVECKKQVAKGPMSINHSITYTFDLALGGMMTNYESHIVSKKGDQPKTQESHEEIEWLRSTDGVIPKSRRVKSQRSATGSPTAEVSSVINFTKISLAAPPKGSVSLSSMEIPEGLVVIDTNSGIRGRYFKGYLSTPATTQAAPQD